MVIDETVARLRPRVDNPQAEFRYHVSDPKVPDRRPLSLYPPLTPSLPPLRPSANATLQITCAALVGLAADYQVPKTSPISNYELHNVSGVDPPPSPSKVRSDTTERREQLAELCEVGTPLRKGVKR